jgi:uncharacterized protein
MKLDDLEESQNVEDRRGSGGGRGAVLGGGLGTIVVLVAVVFFGAPKELLELVGGQGGGTVASAPASPEDEQLAVLVKKVLRSTELVWADEFEKMGSHYQAPHLVIFSHQAQTGCGTADSGVGPFYCPADQTVYIDLSFYRELKQRFGAPGDFAQAYVIAHEIGHHVQHELGLSRPLDEARGRVSETQQNALSVRLELQADFLAGLWARKQNDQTHFLEPGDIEEAMIAAKAIGDDALQRQATGHVVPDSFTHGTSEQRMRWFNKGYQSGDIRQGDTFSAREL